MPEHTPACQYCNSRDVFGMSRVVGYFSIIENWNKSKKEELNARQRGKYWRNEGDAHDNSRQQRSSFRRENLQDVSCE